MRYFLIGMPASGKTTIGKKLSEHLMVPHIDTDEIIEKETGKTIFDFVGKYGEDALRKMEQELLHTFPFPNRAIVSTGGGMPCFFDNMSIIRRLGTTIYLETDIADLVSRIEDSAKKARSPHLHKMNEENVAQFLTELFKKREPYYKRADYIIEQVKDELPDQTVERLLKVLGINK